MKTSIKRFRRTIGLATLAAAALAIAPAALAQKTPPKQPRKKTSCWAARYR